MLVVWSLLVLTLGVFMVITPQTVYAFTQSWKNSTAAEPSDLYLLSTRIGGGFCCLAGAAGIVVQFVA
ncbi:MAG: hypothetical protein PHG02_00335 [Oscillospiraceae bacterium]|nr:hypothetical protein [Oscillospiraceae bacterium]